MATNDLILGITKVGDLLLKKEISQFIKENSKPEKLHNIELTIPVYQRPYKWSVKNSNQLLDDIIQAMTDKKEKYRVGTLILYKDLKNENTPYEIVDGQQRTITFSLLLKALGENDISLLQEKLDINEFNLHNVKTNFRAFTRRLGTDEHKDLKEYILDKCEFIVVITTDLSEAFQFFDSQNTRGKSLYPHDLLKAYHLREMKNISEDETESIIRIWEETKQDKLSSLFKDYLYRLKEWIRANKATELTEKNIDLFKGLSSEDTHPYAQYYKGAFAYADNLNRSALPFVTGSKLVKAFQINAPVIAGKPFFEYAKHYFDLLTDIQNNDRYKGYFINDNEIVKTLDAYYCRRVGDKITRLMFDTAVLLYVDRFCPVVPSRTDLDFFDKFVEYAFIWAYSMRAQYYNVGWQIAQNYIMGSSKEWIKNSLNIYKIIVDADNPNMVISKLSDDLSPLNSNDIVANRTGIGDGENGEDKIENDIFINYLHYFIKLGFWEKEKCQTN